MYAQLAQVASIEGVKDLNFRAEQSKTPELLRGCVACMVFAASPLT
jgi:hypothetical protein